MTLDQEMFKFMVSKALATQEKNKLDTIKIKQFFASKDNIKRLKILPPNERRVSQIIYLISTCFYLT